MGKKFFNRIKALFYKTLLQSIFNGEETKTTTFKILKKFYRLFWLEINKKICSMRPFVNLLHNVSRGGKPRRCICDLSPNNMFLRQARELLQRLDRRILSETRIVSYILNSILYRQEHIRRSGFLTHSVLRYVLSVFITHHRKIYKACKFL